MVVVLLGGCSELAPFPDKGIYHVESDPFYMVYQLRLSNYEHCSFNSPQASNKYLDPEMILALERVNLILSQPEKFAPQMVNMIKESGINKISLASASRSPMQQYYLSSRYKANFMDSFHMLGLAVDLEMEGTPFDVKHNPQEAKMMANYHLLGLVIEKAGLVFSEPMDKDPNHVELFRYCRKKNSSFDQRVLLEKELLLVKDFQRMAEFLNEKNRTQLSKLRRTKDRHGQLLLQILTQTRERLELTMADLSILNSSQLLTERKKL